MITRGTDFPISELRIVKIFFRDPTLILDLKKYQSSSVWLHQTLESLADSKLEQENFKFGPPQIHMMHESEIDTFIKATIKLYYPHHFDSEGRPIVVKLNNLWAIYVSNIQISNVSYWWCSENLQDSDPLAAKLNQESYRRRVWAHPELLQLEKEDRAEEEREEYAADVDPKSIYKDYSL